MDAGDSVAEPRQTNVNGAAVPAAVIPPVKPKRPLANNDPTRNVSRSDSFVRIAVMTFALALLMLLVLAMIAMFGSR